jgi:hypothetical protein
VIKWRIFANLGTLAPIIQLHVALNIPEREKIATLNCVIGAEASQYLANLSLNPDENESAQNILKA